MPATSDECGTEYVTVSSGAAASERRKMAAALPIQPPPHRNRTRQRSEYRPLINLSVFVITVWCLATWRISSTLDSYVEERALAEEASKKAGEEREAALRGIQSRIDEDRRLLREERERFETSEEEAREAAEERAKNLASVEAKVKEEEGALSKEAGELREQTSEFAREKRDFQERKTDLEQEWKRFESEHATLEREKTRIAKEISTLRTHLFVNTDPELFSSPRFLLFVYQHNGGGQGVGQYMNGLLAAHLLADEFDRIVCTQWTEFSLGFFQRQFAEECDALLSNKQILGSAKALMSWNFGSGSRLANECTEMTMLASDVPVIKFEGNTYPKWPAVPRNFFDEYYEPTDALWSILPWRSIEDSESIFSKSPPDMVVHLREGDGKSDKRKGLDNETLEALGNALPADTFLVTNKVAFYDFFAKRWGWTNAGWHHVEHSATKTSWGEGDNSTESTGEEVLRNVATKRGLEGKDLETLKLWSDWFTILKAKQIYHTASDFSQSALHFVGPGSKSKIIMGMRDGDQGRQLDLIDEAWIRDGETEMLRERRLNCESSTERQNIALAPSLPTKETIANTIKSTNKLATEKNEVETSGGDGEEQGDEEEGVGDDETDGDDEEGEGDDDESEGDDEEEGEGEDDDGFEENDKYIEDEGGDGDDEDKEGGD